MKIHEYQAKAILSKYGVAVPRGEMVTTREEAEAAAKNLMSSGAKGVVVKAQIHAGGRGKGGGVKIAKSVAEAAQLAEKMLGMQLVTHQTGPEGKKVQRLLIEETLPIARELYLGIVLDRTVSRPVFMASAAGGMEIEEVAARDPNAIIKEYIDPAIGFEAFQARKVAFRLGLAPEFINPAVKFMQALYKAYEDTDSSLFEINPFITTTDGRVFALDAKVNFDDNALYRHKDLSRTSRHQRGRRAGSGSQQVRPQLHQAGWQRGLHGERRRPGHGDHGHHQVRRRHAGQLPRRGRRSQRRPGDARLRNPADGQECEGRADQHLRRHSARRYAGQWRGRGGQQDQDSASASCCVWKAPTSSRDGKS